MGPKHTPGPWNMLHNVANGVYWIQGAPAHDGGRNIADISDYHNRTPGEIQANAHLIAAAPDLLAALLDMINNFGGNDTETPFIVAARAAIRKAAGEGI